MLSVNSFKKASRPGPSETEAMSELESFISQIRREIPFCRVS